MEEFERDSESVLKSRYKLYRYILYYSVAGIVIYYFILSSLAPVRYVRSINRTFGYDTVSPAIPDMRFLSDSLWLDLSAKRSFSAARIKMAASDSLGFSVNLSDSIVTLEIKGVAVRTVPVISYRTATGFDGIKPYAWINLISEPVSIISSESTIPKESIMVTIAPRDTAEASTRPGIVPDTSFVDPVCFVLKLENGIKLVVIQDCSGKRSDCRAVRRFLCRLAVRNTWSGIKRAALLKMPEYEPEVRIVVSRADARIIYRALPYNGMVVVGIR